MLLYFVEPLWLPGQNVASILVLMLLKKHDQLIELPVMRFPLDAGHIEHVRDAAGPDDQYLLNNLISNHSLLHSLIHSFCVYL